MQRSITRKSINDYKQYLLAAEKAKATVTKYINEAERLAEYLNGAQLSKRALLEYRETLAENFSSRTVNTTLAWQFLRELTAGEENQSMLFTDSHSVSALRSVTDSDETRRILRQDTPGESRTGVEILPEVMEQAAAAPRFRNYDQALLLTERLVQTAMEDEHNLSLQLQRVQHEVQEYLQE